MKIEKLMEVCDWDCLVDVKFGERVLGTSTPPNIMRIYKSSTVAYFGAKTVGKGNVHIVVFLDEAYEYGKEVKS